ncbi:glycine betaine uptake BCCT transporter [Effusibacillus consociatus]|uniref:BCCT family transporter n=1 Tax=Effusibacillus consociatus TaxID=1117041 RepID=A0ABV9PW25_9BACL
MEQNRNSRIVFRVSLLLTSIFILLGIFFNESLSAISSTFLKTTIDQFGWFYLIAAMLFLCFSVYLCFSRFGNIRLGDDTDRPSFGTGSWLAMLFGAGMGIGIVFWGVAEPVYHYVSPPYGTGSTAESASLSMQYTFFHWGLHPWAIYTVIGLSLAFFQFKKKLPALVSSAFYPLLGNRIHGPIGKTIDILAVFATVFGIATSLGLGAMQVAGGMNSLFATPNSTTVQILVIAVAAVLYMISISTGLERGIKYLSNTTMILSFLIMAVMLVLGPTTQIFKTLIHTMGSYINNLPSMSLRLEPFKKDEWLANWTLFYWAWWIAWAPFVGMFIARISKGRTIKEFVFGVLLAPTLGTFVWLSVFGGSVLHFIHNLGNAALAKQVTADVSLALFKLFELFPFTSLLNVLGFIIIVTYYITVADTSTFVLGMLSEQGNLNPSNKIKITWGTIQAFVAIVLLLSGGLEALQTASVTAAFPFAIVMVIMCWALLKGLKNEMAANHGHTAESESENEIGNSVTEVTEQKIYTL